MARTIAEVSVSDRAVSEADIIDRYLKPLSAGFAGAFGLMDDCAAPRATNSS
jgi:hypothetical protein